MKDAYQIIVTLYSGLYVNRYSVASLKKSIYFVTQSGFMKTRSIIIVFIAFLMITGFLSCSKNDEEEYDPAGKCGSVVNSQWSNSGAWKLTVQMDDGYIYKHGVSATPKNLGDRVCF